MDGASLFYGQYDTVAPINLHHDRIKAVVHPYILISVQRKQTFDPFGALRVQLSCTVREQAQ